jgi:MFS family permease
VLFVVSAVTAPFTGRLTDRRGSRFAIATGTILSFVALSGIALYTRHWLHLMAFMACAGIGLALVDPGLTRLVAGAVPEGRRGLVFGLKEGSIPLATMAAGFAVPTIAVTAGWRWAFAVGIIPFVAMIVLLAIGSAGSSQRRYTTIEPAGDDTSRKRTVPPGVLFLAAGAALGSMACTGISVFLTDSALAAGLGQAQGGLLLGVASVIGVAVRIASGMLADRRSGAVRLLPLSR